MSGFILVRDIMTRNVKTVRTDDTVLNAVQKMNKFNIGSVIVMNNTRPVGIITETNIMRRIVEPRMDAGTVWAKDIMTSPLTNIEPNATVEEAAKIMVEKKIKKVPVVEGGKLIGILSSSDIVKAGPAQLGILEELLRIG